MSEFLLMVFMVSQVVALFLLFKVGVHVYRVLTSKDPYEDDTPRL
jgi:hypothetical protein